MKTRIATYLFISIISLVLFQGCLGTHSRQWDYGIGDFSPCVRFEGEKVILMDTDVNPVCDIIVSKSFPVGTTTTVGLTPFSKKEIADAGYRYLPDTEYSFPATEDMDDGTVKIIFSVTFNFTQMFDPADTYAVGFHLTSSNPDLPASVEDSEIVLVIKIGDHGSRSNPWLIYTAEDLLEMSSKLVKNSYKEVCFRLMNDIDMAGINWTPLDPTGERPVFFEGGGHTLKNFTCIATANNVIEAPSFFAYLWGTCQNLTFENPRIVSYYKKAGVVAGTVGLLGWGRDHSGHLRNVHIKGGSVVHYSNNSWLGWTGQAGGLAAELCHWGSTIEECSSSASVNSDYCAGGLVGQANDASHIRRCSCSGNVTAAAVVANGRASDTVFLDPSRHGTGLKWGIAGGIAGIAYNVAIEDCFSTGDITTTDPSYGFAGGIIGMVYIGVDKVERCYSTAKVTGSANAGGIIGTNGDFESGNNHVSKCIAINSQIKVRNNQYPGRICGRMNSNMTNGKASYGSDCYALADIPLFYSNYKPFHPEDSPLSQFDKMDSEKGIQYYQGLETSDPVATARDILNWSTDIWDFGGSLPELLHN